MAIEQGDRLPDGTLVMKDADGPRQITVAELTAGRRIVMFCLPGAFTATCSAAHLPSFVRTAQGFREKGIDDIACVSVNDAHVMAAWGEDHGAQEAGILMLGDGDGSFGAALGRTFDNPTAGMYGRMVRCAMIVNDGVVDVLQLEEGIGTCDLTAGETLLSLV